MSIESVMPSNHLILCHPLLLPASIFPSIRVFSNESVLHIRWPKYWSFSFSISPSNEYSRTISFRVDWLDLLAVQGTLKSLLQYHSSKALMLLHSAFFIVQLSHPYMTTGKLKSTQFTVSAETAVATLFHDLVGSCSSDRLSPGLNTQLSSKGSLRVPTYVPQSQMYRVWADLGLQTGKLIKTLPQGSPKSM